MDFVAMVVDEAYTNTCQSIVKIDNCQISICEICDYGLLAVPTGVKH